MKLVEAIKVTSRVRGQIWTYKELPLLWVDQKARDIFRGKASSICEAREMGVGAIAVDETLLARARQKGAMAVLVHAEDLGNIYMTAIANFYDEAAQTRIDFRHRRVRQVNLEKCKVRTLSR